MLNRRTLLRNAATFSAGMTLAPAARSFGAILQCAIALSASSETPFRLPA